MAKMELHRKVLLVNVSVIAALFFEYLRGSNRLAIVITAVFVLALVNTIFLLRVQRAKKTL